MRGELERDAVERGLRESVVFTGSLPHEDVASVIRLFDVALAPYPRPDHDCGIIHTNRSQCNCMKRHGRRFDHRSLIKVHAIRYFVKDVFRDGHILRKRTMSSIIIT